MNASSQRRKWRRWLQEDLRSEIAYLQTLKIVYKKLADIVVRSSAYPKINHFYWYIGQAHSAATVAGIYRLVDTRSDVVTLRRLLIEIENKPKLVSRRAYTRLKVKDRDKVRRAVEKKHLNKEFTQLAGNGQHLKATTVSRDINRLDYIRRKIENLRHKYIAHHAHNQKRYKVKQTFKQTHACIDELETIFRKYHQLVVGGDIHITSNCERQDIENDIDLIFQ